MSNHGLLAFCTKAQPPVLDRLARVGTVTLVTYREITVLSVILSSVLSGFTTQNVHPIVPQFGELAATMLAINILKWPGVNQAFMFSFAVTLVLIYAIMAYGKRRKPGAPVTWGEAMFGSVYVFFVLFLAFGVVPHQWIDHADKNLGWRKDKLLLGPFDILKPKAFGGQFPFTISYEALRDIVVVVIHVIFMGILIGLAAWWQKRGQAVTKEIETSPYGRPLVKKA